jgi:hypothetical protein
MFANKNNHLLKKLLRGGAFSEKPSVVKTLPFTPDLSPKEKTPSPETNPIDIPPSAEYPDTKYLYKNITSNNNISKINVCAFNKGDFIKYIVQEEDGRAVFPSFVFENTQRGGFLDGDSEPTDLDNLFKQKVEEFVKTFFLKTGGETLQTSHQSQQNPKQINSQQGLDQIPDETNSQQGLEQTLEQINSQQNPDQIPDETNSQQGLEQTLDETNSQQGLEQTPDEIISQQGLEQTPDEIISQQGLEQTPDEIISQQGLEQIPNENNSQQDLEQPPDENNSQQGLEQTLDENNSQQGLEQTPDEIPSETPTSTYIGYIMVNGEPYVFASISPGKLGQQFREALLNELFYLFKVDNLDVDKTVKDVFDNNRWLLNESEPYSGYMCKMDQAGQLVNIKEDEEEDMTNIETIGDFYYFSFQPLDTETLYKKFAIFPNEYVCILDESQMAQYKTNKMSYAEEKTIYFKGEALETKRNGIEFMCVRTPSNFAQI